MKTTRNKIAGTVIAGTIACAVPAVCQWEGLWLTAKPDRLAYGIPTVCYGETEGVKVGDTYTKEQCADMLANKLPRYLDEIDRCIKVPISDRTRASYLSFAYNVGSAGFCRSSALKLLNAGNERGSCDALMQWTRAGGKFVQGLQNRRVAERAQCLKGISEPKQYIAPGAWKKADAVEKTMKHAEVINPQIKAEPKPALPAKPSFWSKFKAWFWSK